MKTCLVISDSIGFPRENPYTPFENTWLGLLEPILNSKGYMIYAFQKKGLTTERVVEELKDHLNLIKPDLLILQIGIVDCSPRALKESEIIFINRIPIVRNFIKKAIKKYYQRISKFRNLCYVDINFFEKNLNIINKSFHSCDKIIIPIGLACGAYIKKSPLIENRINQYNLVQKKIFNLNYMELFTQKTSTQLDYIYTEDFYHLNDLGHKVLYEALLEKIRNENSFNH